MTYTILALVCLIIGYVIGLLRADFKQFVRDRELAKAQDQKIDPVKFYLEKVSETYILYKGETFLFQGKDLEEVFKYIILNDLPVSRIFTRDNALMLEVESKTEQLQQVIDMLAASNPSRQ